MLGGEHFGGNIALLLFDVTDFEMLDVMSMLDVICQAFTEIERFACPHGKV